MSVLTNVISVLAAATGSSAELDLEIAYHLRWRHATEGHIHIPGTDIRRQWWRKPDGRSHYGLPRWTESADDALTLVPERYGFSFVYAPFPPTSEPPFYGLVLFRNAATDKLQQIGMSHHAKSLAIAICLAALKARDTLARAS